MAKKHNLPLRGVNSDGASVQVNEVEVGYLVQLAGWGNFADAADKALRSQSLSIPTDYRAPVSRGMMTVWRIAPDRVLVRSDSKLEFASTNDLVALDLSQARVCLTLDGPGTAGLLSRVIALDFDELLFPIGTFVQTSLHHVGVLVERQRRDQLTVIIPTTWARSLTDYLISHLALAV
ncbi:hypothetical protein X743_33405 [Mesorhizobium sp. LNHC252B00]|uniref:hypothetical protein n=1 Tax=Mesorhizobium sp. LNHC252B00 TaxID=1287252 RepID=UPI0003CE2869|nr:hypothetical protein [Mesorhizobium sp. LNHC252B00]ESY63176.1 hypothetical protein X743_33405 [Mesorhizobium sp. LNHC252B00]